MRTVKVDLPDCAGVTDDFGHHYRAGRNNEVTIPTSVADRLERSKAVRKPYRVFGGITLPAQQTLVPDGEGVVHATRQD